MALPLSLFFFGNLAGTRIPRALPSYSGRTGLGGRRRCRGWSLAQCRAVRRGEGGEGEWEAREEAQGERELDPVQEGEGRDGRGHGQEEVGREAAGVGGAVRTRQ